MTAPTDPLISVGFEAEVAVVTDGRFGGGMKCLCIDHVSLDAVRDGLVSEMGVGQAQVISPILATSIFIEFWAVGPEAQPYGCEGVVQEGSS